MNLCLFYSLILLFLLILFLTNYFVLLLVYFFFVSFLFISFPLAMLYLAIINHFISQKFQNNITHRVVFSIEIAFNFQYHLLLWKLIAILCFKSFYFKYLLSVHFDLKKWSLNFFLIFKSYFPLCHRLHRCIFVHILNNKWFYVANYLKFSINSSCNYCYLNYYEQFDFDITSYLLFGSTFQQMKMSNLSNFVGFFISIIHQPNGIFKPAH